MAAPLTKRRTRARDDQHAVGTARRIDQLGRVVVPAELRKMMGLRNGDVVDFRFVDGHIAILRLDPECALCSRSEQLTTFEGKQLCAHCLDRIRHQPDCAICGALEGLVERNGKHVCSSCVREISIDLT
ncbi:MAG TPA: AbrB/MazE/SpoVT family DNA-binding domain-containing protein [Acidimicrobiia bacterium]|nr:AbrB/MazE/SpoVT family DNA-binding domain-containing protein [Acidimicrobiia bacterium]